ncbi:hypothetical protein [Runella salmonicolor]|uniref:Uncharacterized protein n=1 Tax=Runella salmonicolor TaxID=2950278 RepID=A0ABT1FVC7_9BACT|nr:hypothetical protein [Runella salmonicolor]MCP1385714.1 hypothetical protein [Runella salmonicolor]
MFNFCNKKIVSIASYFSAINSQDITVFLNLIGKTIQLWSGMKLSGRIYGNYSEKNYPERVLALEKMIEVCEQYDYNDLNGFLLHSNRGNNNESSVQISIGFFEETNHVLISINKNKLSISNNQFFNLLDELSKICNFNYGMIFKSRNFENAIMYGSYGKNNDFFNFKKIDLSENDFVKLKEGYFRNLQKTNFVTDIHLKRIADYYDLKKSIEKKT